MGGVIFWQGQKVEFCGGESAASALARAGITQLGVTGTGQMRGVFCGIGQCQNCLVTFDGRTVEACLLTCRDGMVLQPQERASDDG
ncbi:2Fe-2S iron-sulfur cluster-binding protein [Plastorhodobacter daqingensis]|uniref:2Fe-2S iron-sulfur cluster-binding protein n=1 Tax=Plastorhodobacter daqingensis TaxID=1387281 RepID=A0ABW2UPF3_9RHOB